MRATCLTDAGRTRQALSPDGARVATASGDGTVRVWEMDNGALWDEIDCTDSGAVSHAAWTRGGASDAAALLLTAHFDLQKETSRVLVRADDALTATMTR